jgi:hypothetical protein
LAEASCYATNSSSRAAKAFPKSLLHPTIADGVWSALVHGDLDEAVFKSFKAVEEAVRRRALQAALP